MSLTSHAMAVVCIQVPISDIPCPIKNRRKLRCASERSIVAIKEAAEGGHNYSPQRHKEHKEERKETRKSLFGSFPSLGPLCLCGESLLYSSDFTALRIASASMPAACINSAGVPEPGRSPTASLTTRRLLRGSVARASNTASPRPPSGQWSSTVPSLPPTAFPVSSS